MKYQRFISLLSVCLVATQFAFPGLCADDDDGGYRIKLSDWFYTRQRKTITGSNRVTGALTVKNTSKDDLKDVVITLRFTSGLGEKAAEPGTKKIGDVKAGETRKIEVVAEFVPAFEAYEVGVAYSAGGKDNKEEWFSSSDVGQPQPKSSQLDKGVANIMILGREGNVDRAGVFNGTLRIKNQGTVEAKNVKCQITFYDSKQKNIAEVSCKLGTGKVAGGAEVNIPVTIPNCPRNFGGFLIKLTSDDTPPEAADFTNIADVEFARFNFKREPKSPDLKITAQVRNGFDAPVKNVKLILSFLNAAKKEIKSFTYDHAAPVNGGETQPVSFTVPALPAYDSFEQKIGYEKCGGGGGEAAATPTAVAAADKSAQPNDTKIETPHFKELADVEVIFSSHSTDPDKTVVLIGAMRNGKPGPVKDVVISVLFDMPGGKTLTGEKTLSDVIQPGEQRNFVLKTPNAAGFKDYSYKFTSDVVK